MYIMVDEHLRVQYKDTYIILIRDDPDPFSCVLGRHEIEELQAIFNDWLQANDA